MVVMMNLLNGLAVSDTGVIKEEAEIYAYKGQVEIISYLEAMMLGGKLMEKECIAFTKSYSKSHRLCTLKTYFKLFTIYSRIRELQVSRT